MCSFCIECAPFTIPMLPKLAGGTESGFLIVFLMGASQAWRILSTDFQPAVVLMSRYQLRRKHTHVLQVHRERELCACAVAHALAGRAKRHLCSGSGRQRWHGCVVRVLAVSSPHACCGL